LALFWAWLGAAGGRKTAARITVPVPSLLSCEDAFLPVVSVALRLECAPILSIKSEPLSTGFRFFLELTIRDNCKGINALVLALLRFRCSENQYICPITRSFPATACESFLIASRSESEARGLASSRRVNRNMPTFVSLETSALPGDRPAGSASQDREVVQAGAIRKIADRKKSSVDEGRRSNNAE
jgi:hypothetical protein